MFKQLLFIIIASSLAAIFTTELYSLLHVLGSAQTVLIRTIDSWLPVFKLSDLVSKVIILVFIPIIISFLVAFIYWLFKREEMPRLSGIAWTLWVVSLLIFVLYR